jgi:1,4-alpha-glucan branching enzyme
MPYVEGFGTWPFGEEWLWEAVASAYVPLLDVLDGAPVTVSLTPVLCDQLEAMRGDAGDRYLRFLREIRAPIHAEDSAGLDASGKPELAAELRRAAGDYVRADEGFERRDRDLLAAFADLGTELWTSAATHAVLPLLATDAGLHLQVGAGIAAHERRFGEDWSGGFWLPECAYEPGLERDLAEHGVRAFCVDQTDVGGLGAPEHLEPVATESGYGRGTGGIRRSPRNDAPRSKRATACGSIRACAFSC